MLTPLSRCVERRKPRRAPLRPAPRLSPRPDLLPQESRPGGRLSILQCHAQTPQSTQRPQNPSLSPKSPRTSNSQASVSKDKKKSPPKSLRRSNKPLRFCKKNQHLSTEFLRQKSGRRNFRKSLTKAKKIVINKEAKI